VDDDGYFLTEFGAVQAHRVRVSEMRMRDKCSMAQAAAAVRKDKQAMAVAAFYTLAYEKLKTPHPRATNVRPRGIRFSYQ